MSKVAETFFIDERNHLIKIELFYSERKMLTVSGKNITEDSNAIYFSSKNKLQTAVAKIVVIDRSIVTDEFIEAAIKIFEHADERGTNMDFTKIQDDPKLIAAAKYTGFVQSELSNVTVMTEEEATNASRKKIEDTLTDLNIDFLAKHMIFSEHDEIMGMHFDTKEAVLEKIELCKQSGDEDLAKFLIKFYVKDMDGLIEDYIDLAGRGDVLNPVNGEEHTVDVNGVKYFVYDK